MNILLKASAPVVVGRGYLSSDHISTATGLDPAITISKNGGTFNAPSGTALMSEIEATGWYKYTLGAGDTDTIGPLIIRGTHATMDNIEVVYQVVETNVAANVIQVEGSDATDTIQSSCNAALVVNSLDHLCLTPTSGVDMSTEVNDGSIISRIVSSSDISTFVPATHSLQVTKAKIDAVLPASAAAGAVSGLVINDAANAYTPKSIYDVATGVKAVTDLLHFTDTNHVQTDVITVLGGTPIGSDLLPYVDSNGRVDVSLIEGIDATTQIDSTITTNTSVAAIKTATDQLKFTGTTPNTFVKADVVDIAGAAVSTTTAQLGVNVVQVGTTVQTAKDLGLALPAYAPGIANGLPVLDANIQVPSNLKGIMGTALVDASNYIVAAFQKFFKVSGPTGTVNSIPDAVAGVTSGLSIVGSAMTLTNTYDAAKTAATQTSVNTIDTVVDAIKVQTDLLQFDSNGNVLADAGTVNVDISGLALEASVQDILDVLPATVVASKQDVDAVTTGGVFINTDSNGNVYTVKDDTIDDIKAKTDNLPDVLVASQADVQNIDVGEVSVNINTDSNGNVYTVSDGIIESIYNNTESIKGNVLDILIDTEAINNTAEKFESMIEDVSGDRFTAHALQAGGVGTGAGTINYSYTVTFVKTINNIETTVAVPQCKVWATTDPTGLDIVCSGYTDDFGAIIFYLDIGVYYFWRKKSGFDFTNPVTATVI